MDGQKEEKRKGGKRWIDEWKEGKKRGGMGDGRNEGKMVDGRKNGWT